MGREQELFLAVREGNIAQVTKIITKVHANRKTSNKKLNINHQDQDGMTYLHQAALNGNVEVMKMFIDSGCYVDTKDSKGMRPLHYAAWQGKHQHVSLLLKSNSSVNQVSHDGNSPLHLASEHGHTVVVEMLIEHGADVTIANEQHKTALDVACEFGRVKVVEALLLLEPGRVLLAARDEDIADNDRTTCLHLASRNGHLDVILLLLRAGIDINRQTLQGTCLHEASKYGKVEVVRLLLDNGVDATRLNSYEQTALEIVNKFTTSKAAKELKQILKADANWDLMCNNHHHDHHHNHHHHHHLDLDLEDVKRKRKKGMRRRVGSTTLSLFRIFLHHTKKACSENPNKSSSAEIPYFGSPSYSTIGRDGFGGSGGSKQQQPKRHQRHVLDSDDRQSPILFQSTRPTDDDDVFYAKAATVSLASSSSSVTGTSKNQNDFHVEQRDSGVSSNLSVKALKPFSQIPANNNLNSRRPQGLLSIQGDSRRCYDTTHFTANHVQGILNHSRNRVSGSSGGSGGSESNVSVKSCRPYFLNVTNNSSNNNVDYNPQSILNSNINNNNNRLSGQSYESGVSTSSRHSFHSNGSSGSGPCGECPGGHVDELGGYSSLGNFPDLLSQGRTNVDAMHSWLTCMNLEDLFHLFKEAGYDMPTISRMTPEDLNAIGITKPNVRKKLKYEIGRLNIPDGLPDFIPESVHDWLELLNLVQYEQALLSQGYKDINSLLQITWEDLEEIGVTKLGHQKKITLAIDRLKRLLSNPSSSSSSSSSPSPSVDSGTTPAHADPRQRHFFQRPPYTGYPNGGTTTTTTAGIYSTIDDCGRRGSVGSTSGIGRNRKSSSGESLQRLVELRNLSDFLSADPASVAFDDSSVWQPRGASSDERTTTSFVRARNFDPQSRSSAERTFCSPGQSRLFGNDPFEFAISRQSKLHHLAPLDQGRASTGDTTPTNERRIATSTPYGDVGYFQDAINNNNNNNIGNSINQNHNQNNNNQKNNDGNNTIDSLLDHYMSSSFEAEADPVVPFKGRDHPLMPPSYLYGTDRSERKASDELRDLTLRTGPYASIPQPSDVALEAPPRKDRPPPPPPPLPPARSNSFRAETRSLLALAGDRKHRGRFEMRSDSTIAVVAEEEDENDPRDGQSEDHEASPGLLRKSSSASSLSSSSDGSVGAADGNTLPFANENVGTIKQRNNNNNNNNNRTQTNDDDTDVNNGDVANNNNNNSNCSFDGEESIGSSFESGENLAMTEASTGHNGSNSDKLFNDIDGMLLGLTQELDEMLKLQL